MKLRIQSDGHVSFNLKGILAIFLHVVYHQDKRNDILSDSLDAFSREDPSKNNNEWDPDNQFKQQFSLNCDIPVFTGDTHGIVLGDYPFILRNYASHWTAREKWRKTEFLKSYGDRVIRSGSESSIVHSGGVAENAESINTIVERMDKIRITRVHNSSSNSNQKNKVAEAVGGTFVFDPAVLKTIPELRTDIHVHPIFQDFDNEVNETEGSMWHMLSLGPSRSGLPFHNHGQTWIGVVHGAKHWFLYPPGYGPPHWVDAEYNPIHPVSHWLESIYSRLQIYPKPPKNTFFPPFSHWRYGSSPEHRPSLRQSNFKYGASFGAPAHPEMSRRRAAHFESSGATLGSTTSGYRPVECTQQAGDVLYLPTRWTHMTLNIGETIAFGGQETLLNSERYRLANNVLKEHPRNYDALKDIGLALSNQAATECEKLRESAKITDTGLVLFTHLPVEQAKTEFERLLKGSQSTWMVLHYDPGSFENIASDGSYEEIEWIQMLWEELAELVEGDVDVALLPTDPETHIQHSLQRDKLFEHYFHHGHEKDSPDHYSHHENSLRPKKKVKKYATGDHEYEQQLQYLLRAHTRVHVSHSPEGGGPGDEDSRNLLHRFPTNHAGIVLKVHRGRGKNQKEEDFEPDLNGTLLHPLDAAWWEIDEVDDFALHYCQEKSLLFGSLARISVKAKFEYKKATHYLSQALEVKPLNPEILNMVGETAGMADDFQLMEEVLYRATNICDDLALVYLNGSTDVPALSICSMYHKIATAYMGRMLTREAIPLLEKSTEICPTFFPSLVELPYVYVEDGRVEEALKSLENLSKISFTEDDKELFQELENHIRERAEFLSSKNNA